MERKTKFSISFKETLVREYLHGVSSSEELSCKYGISSRYLRRLAKRYSDTGCLGTDGNNNLYGKDFKLGCVLSVLRKKLSLSEATSRFGIPNDSTLVKWINLYDEFGEQGLETTKPGRPKLMAVEKKKKEEVSSDPKVAAMQQELEYLRAENAYLKKLSALIQQKELKASKSGRKPSKN